MLVPAWRPGHGRNLGHLHGQVEGRVPLCQGGGERGRGGVVLMSAGRATELSSEGRFRGCEAGRTLPDIF